MLRNLPFLGKFFLVISVFVLTGLLFNLNSNINDYLGKSIVRIDFKGNVNYSNKDLFNIISIRPGMKLTLKMVNDDTRKIFNEKAFDKVSVDVENYKSGVRLTFILKERPEVDRIKFRGLDAISEKETLETILLKEGEIYSSRKVSESIAMLRFKYEKEGLFNTLIRVREIKNKEKNLVDIIFIIDEGEDIKISKINLLGVYKLDPEDVLDVLKHEEEGFIADGVFKEELFESDKQNILKYYQSKGYLDVEILDSRWELSWENPFKKEKRVILITYKIQENEQSFFNGYDIEWDKNFLNPTTKSPLFKKNFLYNYFELTNHNIGDLLNKNKFDRDRGIINFLYSERGYIFARVIPEKTTIHLTSKEIENYRNDPRQVEASKKGIDYFHLEDLSKILADEPELEGKPFIHHKFIIAEGDKGFLESIIIKGNESTLDKVIRRELLIKEGELFNYALVQRSREKVFNLGFFKKVNIDVRPGSREGLMNLIVDVEEQGTGKISLGGGHGIYNSFSIHAEFEEKNLNGTAQSVSSKVEFGPLKTLIQASWTEPWMFDVPWSLTLSGFYSLRQVRTTPIDLSSSDESSSEDIFKNILEDNSENFTSLSELANFDKQSVGSSVGVGHRFGLNWGHFHRFSLTFSKALNPSTLVSDSIFLLIDQGWLLKNTLTNGIYYDDRDNIFSTTKGQRADLSVDLVGGVLGGSQHYVRYNSAYKLYWSPFDFTFGGLIRYNILRRWRAAFEHRFSTTFTQVTKPIYKTQDPRDNPYIKIDDRLFIGGYESLRGWNSYDEDYPVSWREGGSHRLLFGSEFRLPVEPSLLWLVLFLDGGALYHNFSDYDVDETTKVTLVKSLKNSKLSFKNLSPSYFRYSWGFGFRLQIPILPLRIYLAQKFIWDSNKKKFAYPDGGAGDFEFVFGIGDYRF